MCEPAMDPAILADPHSLWLNSPDALLQVLCCVAFCGHDARNFSSLTRAFRGDEVLWGCIKDRRAGRGRTLLMACARRGEWFYCDPHAFFYHGLFIIVIIWYCGILMYIEKTDAMSA